MAKRIVIKPCPFCGSTEINTQIALPTADGIQSNAVCENCGASGPIITASPHVSDLVAYNEWNKRHIPVYDPFKAEIVERNYIHETRFSYNELKSLDFTYIKEGKLQYAKDGYDDGCMVDVNTDRVCLWAQNGNYREVVNIKDIVSKGDVRETRRDDYV